MKKRPNELHCKGISLSEGIACAKICLYNEDRHASIAVYKVAHTMRKSEKKRLERAFEIAEDQLSRLIEDVEARIGAAESKIFVAQKMILEDTSVREEMFEEIEVSGTNAEGVVAHVLDRYETRLSAMDNEYIKTRATDIGEIKRRILDVLMEVNPALQCMGQANCEHGKDRVIIARELTPSLTVSLDTKNASGFVTEHGGKLSHAAILARSLGIPAVSGIKNLLDTVYCGTEILVDGDNGEIFIWPSRETIEKYRIGKSEVTRKKEAPEPVEGLSIFANINLSQDVDEAKSFKAEGIGLYRTEFEFLAQGRLLSEDEQYERYTRVLEAMSGKPVYFRLLDIGGDKEADFFLLPRESNPYLGFRGSRLLLARPELLVPQVRALARASVVHTVYILYPMIVDLGQFLELKRSICSAIEGIVRGDILHGVMFEVPSACLEAKAIMERADFASIGSNDLIQYLFAVDRNNEHVAYDYSPDRQVFWSLLATLADASRSTGKSLSICGEIASSRIYIDKLIELGIKNISVSSRLIPGLRGHIRESSRTKN